MEDNKILQAILEAINDMRGDIAELKEGQKTLEEGQKALEEGQNALRRDIARVERKIDKQGNDISDTLYYLTQAVDEEFNKLRKAR